MTAAKAIGDKGAAAKKMSEANSILSSPLLNTLAILDGKVKTLREKIVAAQTAAEHERVKAAAPQQLPDGHRRTTGAATIVQTLDGVVCAATNNVTRVIDAQRRRRRSPALRWTPRRRSGEVPELRRAQGNYAVEDVAVDGAAVGRAFHMTTMG
jgi:hypothetical protein